MSALYSLTDAAVFRPATPARESVVELGGRVTAALPITAAIPLATCNNRLNLSRKRATLRSQGA